MKKIGFDYYLDKNILKNYQKKSIRLRLEWLYYANNLRKHYSKDIIEKHEKFRNPKN